LPLAHLLRVSPVPASLAQARARLPAPFTSTLDDPTEQGRAVSADGGYGSRSQFETECWRFRPRTKHVVGMTPLDKMLGNLAAS
jgi:sulfane dehydrogenase subunit SoxC